MAYTALYRKFRPLTFSEMVGQEHITKTLRNQIIAGRVGHAYLLNGVRGTGKTSTAKILARAINCLNPIDGEPCNECEICKAALAGSLTDIVEMDAASNNSVEDIRTIREEVNFLPTVAKYRVYIIDEVHMLSTGAFNALLKTLEEPPEHVKFILATTEPQKLPATILSRCQRIDFKKIPDSDIIKRLKIVCEESNLKATDEALKVIAVLSEGALRDALSILERCIQDGTNEITENKIKDLVGIPKFDSINELTTNIIENDAIKCLNKIEEIINTGKDASNILWEIIKYLRDILLYKTSKNEGIYSKEEIEKINELSTKASKERLIKLIYEFSKLENDIKWSSQKNIMFEAGLIKACNSDENNGIEELEKRVNLLENKVNSGNIVTTKVKNIENDVIPNKSITVKESNTVKNENNQNNKIVYKIGKEDPKINEEWNKVVNQFKTEGKIMIYTNLLNTRLTQINDLFIGIEFPNGLTAFGKTVLEKNENMNELIRRISIIFGKEMKIKLVDLTKKDEVKKISEIESLAKDMDLPINIIEE